MVFWITASINLFNNILPLINDDLKWIQKIKRNAETTYSILLLQYYIVRGSTSVVQLFFLVEYLI